MRDGSDAIADWPILNALVNVAAGASWVSVHHGGGVGIGNSIHAGMVVVADGSDEMAERLERVLTTDPGMGVVRHLDAGYPEAEAAAARARAPRARRRPRRGDRCWRGSSSAISPRSRRRTHAPLPARGRRPRRRRGDRGRLRALRRGTIEAVGRMRDLPGAGGRDRGARRARAERGARARRLPHASGVRRRPGRRVLASGPAGASYEELHAAGGGILSTVAATRALGEAALARARRAARRLDAPARHDDVGGQVGLRARPRHRAGVAARRSARGRIADLARRPCSASRAA